MDKSAIKLPRLHRLFLEPLGVTELVNILPAHSALRDLPEGNGEPVLIVPGLSTGDWSTAIIRKFLRSKNFNVYGWDQGLNITYTDKVEQKLAKRVEAIAKRHGRKVTLIGWSLGGVTIRIFAKHHPENVRQLISLGGPFSDLKGKTYVGWWYHILAGESVQRFNEEWTRQAAEQPDVPSTSIYSKTDGMVSWEYCIDWETGPITQNVEVLCNHLGFGMNPAVWYIVHDRLLQPENHWELFDISRIRDIEQTSWFHV